MSSQGSNDGALDWTAMSLSTSNFTIGGGRVDGSFFHTQPPGSYEDFTYPSPFSYQDTLHSYPSHAPSTSSYSSNSFSLFPSSSSSSAPLPSLPSIPSPPPAAPLLDQSEQSLFSTFLTTLDIDPKFLFNPILPPGMPSPPSQSLLPGNEEGWGREKREREELGRRLEGGLELLNENALAAGSKRKGKAREVEYDDRRQEYEENVLEQEEEVPTPQGAEDDSDFDPNRDEEDFEPGVQRRSRARGDASSLSRRKSRSGGVSGSIAGLGRGRGGKKSRISPPQPERGSLPEEDSAMLLEGSEDAIEEEEQDDDPDYSEEATVRLPAPSLATTRSKRARPPSTAASSRRNSISSSSNTVTTVSTTPNPNPRPSLSKVPNNSTASSSRSNLPPSSSQQQTTTPSIGSSQQLTQSQKRQNHIISEQRRRNAIKLNFKDLVELVIRGQTLSGVLLGADLTDPAGGGSDDETGGGGTGRGGKKRAATKRGKKSTAATTTVRGRGRKGDTGANASKSVVLEKAKEYICWLERGNRGLERELARVEGLLAAGESQAV